MILEIALGVVLGVVLVLFARSQRPRSEIVLLAVGLVVTALLYVGFALVGGAGAPAFVPRFFPVFCIGFDLLVAGYLAARVYSGRVSPPEAVT